MDEIDKIIAELCYFDELRQKVCSSEIPVAINPPPRGAVFPGPMPGPFPGQECGEDDSDEECKRKIMKETKKRLEKTANSLGLVKNKTYNWEEVTENFSALHDVRNILDWLKIENPDNVQFRYDELPVVGILGTNIKQRMDSLDKFPESKKRVDKILKKLENGQHSFPIYIEEGDPHLFIMEGRHRAIAFILNGMDKIPVFFVKILRS
jgi:hypothetical protein